MIRSAFGIETIADFSAEDMLQLTKGINGTGMTMLHDLSGRIEGLGGDAWLDLGGGNGVVFLGVGADELAGLLQTNLTFI